MKSDTASRMAKEEAISLVKMFSIANKRYVLH